MRQLLKFIVVLVVLTGLATGAAGYYLVNWLKTPVASGKDEVIIEFAPGTSLRQLADTLNKERLISRPEPFWAYVRLMNNYQRFQAGRYRFEGPLTPAAIMDTMIKGDVYRPVVLRFTIPEGFTMRQVLERLAALSVGHIKELQGLASDPEFAKSLNVESGTLEGYLYPATYIFTEMPSPPEVLRHMVQTFWNKLPADYRKRLAPFGLSLHEAVTFASLIELETRHDDERARVSEVIWNRLKKGMALGIDAAIIYGIPDYDGDIKWKHLKDAANPYNLRIHRGLPPTPIGSPSLESLLAVLTPADQGNFYYVLVPGSDRHHFSKTLKEHEKHVQKLKDAAKRPRNGL